MTETAALALSRVSNAPAETVLSVRNLRVSFPDGHGGQIEAVRGLNLDVRAGEFVGLMGEPGCGKSTAATAMLGAVRVPGRISGGTVHLLGQDIGTIGAEKLRQMRGRDAAIIMQNPRYALHPMLTVGQQIVAACRAHTSMSHRQARMHAINLLRMVGINDPARRVDALAHELSSGMAQRVLIAIALSGEPRLLIADEPTSGLDVTIQAQILDQMWDNCRRIGSAVLLVTQDLGVVANYCDRVLIMMNGALVEDADATRFFRAPEHAYSRRILALQREAHSQGVAPAPVAAAPLLRIEGLTKLFAVRGSRSRVHAVDNVDLAIGPGECVGLVGESGSGKTTVGRCVLRLLPPTAGAIAYRGGDLGRRVPHLPAQAADRVSGPAVLARSAHDRGRVCARAARSAHILVAHREERPRRRAAWARGARSRLARRSSARAERRAAAAGLDRARHRLRTRVHRA